MLQKICKIEKRRPIKSLALCPNRRAFMLSHHFRFFAKFQRILCGAKQEPTTSAISQEMKTIKILRRLWRKFIFSACAIKKSLKIENPWKCDTEFRWGFENFIKFLLRSLKSSIYHSYFANSELITGKREKKNIFRQKPIFSLWFLMRPVDKATIELLLVWCLMTMQEKDPTNVTSLIAVEPSSSFRICSNIWGTTSHRLKD